MVMTYELTLTETVYSKTKWCKLISAFADQVNESRGVNGVVSP